MSWPSLHALVNHFPIVLVVVGALCVLLAAVHERRGIWVYALTSLVLAGATIYPASFTGERAEHAVKDAWYIAPHAIEVHSQAADVTLWVVGVTGLLALVTLVTMVRSSAAQSPGKGFRVLVGLGALASFCAVAYTGYLGGKVVIESPILASPAPPLPATTGTVIPPATTAAPVTPAKPGVPVPQAATPQGTVPQTQTQVPAPQRP